MSIRSQAKYLFWIFANLYGRLFGHSRLASFHQSILILTLHGLGYDNLWKDSYTGEKRFIEKVLRPSNPRVCIDIGANVGHYSALLLQHTTAKVFAFEPAESSFADLSKLNTSFPERLFPIKKAISDRSGEAHLYSAREKSATASLDARVVAHASHEAVATTTLDAFVEEQKLSHIDFIKIDVEGYEREVLRGMQKTLQAHRPRFVQFEFNIMQLRRGYSLLELTTLLKGYTFYRLLPTGLIKIDPNGFSSNIFMFCNIVAMR